MSDIVRVLRIIEYVGERGDIEEQIAHSLHGTKRFNRGSHLPMEIRVATIGEYPEILASNVEITKDGDATTITAKEEV